MVDCVIMPTLTTRGKSWIPKRKALKNKKVWADDTRYHTTQWRKYRKQFLMNNPLCIECKRAGKIIPANVVGHIIPVSQQPELFWESTNHKPLCKSCNSRTQKDRKR